MAIVRPTALVSPVAATKVAKAGAAIESALPDLVQAPLYKQLKDPNFFNERRVPTSLTQVPEDSGRTLERMGDDASLHFNGIKGRAMAARFVDRIKRTDGDFRYAYGRDAYKAFEAGDAEFGTVPVGELKNQLDLDLLMRVHEKAFRGKDRSVGERVYHQLQTKAAGTRFVAGRLRTYPTNARPASFTPLEVSALELNTCRFVKLPGGEPGLQRGVILYVPPLHVKPKTEELLADIRRALADPNTNPIELAAEAAQRFVAIHPFQDGNGRTARLLLDRILKEYGIEPPILRDINQDLALCPEVYRDEVMDGILRMRDAIGSQARFGPLSYLERLFEARNRTLGEAVSAPSPVVRLDGSEFAQGNDGFIYDVAGRPHLFDKEGVLQPWGQLNHYFMARRAMQADDPIATLQALTAESRAHFEKVQKDPALQERTPVLSDEAAICSDAQYRLHTPAMSDAFIELFDLSRISGKRLFAPAGSPGQGTAASFAMSRYQQLDLELFHVQSALQKAKDPRAERVLESRRKLFDQAQVYLRATAPRTRATPENPFGLSKNYERLMLEHSRLNFETFDDAQRAFGDKTFVWRGDKAVAKYMGVFPDSIPGRPDARALARTRARDRGSFNLIGDLEQFSKSSLGSGYQAYTSDLGLLHGATGFAGKTETLKLSMTDLPEALRKIVGSRLKPGTELHVDALRDALKKGRQMSEDELDLSNIDPESAVEAIERSLPFGVLSREQRGPFLQRVREIAQAAEQRSLKDRLTGNRDAKGTLDLRELLPDPRARARLAESVNKALDPLRDYVTVRRTTDDTVVLSSHRRAFGIEMDMEDVLPGQGVLGGTFEGEQEMTGVKSVLPNRMKKMFLQAQLDRDLPRRAAEPSTEAGPRDWTESANSEG